MQKHPKPLEQKTTKELIENFNFIYHNPKLGQIADIACGYGRNGAYFVDLGYTVNFVDYDIDCLNFIKAGKNVSENGNINLSLINTLKLDLRHDQWPFEKNSLSGIINVHFYIDNLIDKFIDSLRIGGFIYIETINANPNNLLELPQYKYIYNKLKPNFNLLFYKEKLIEPNLFNLSTLKIFGTKIT